ncbi:unnamed protein product [Closterium sp. Naga37s-1]|nr:unnamed protein product [Closterium sp. Naga37s-1]
MHGRCTKVAFARSDVLCSPPWQVYEKAEGRDPERVGRMVGIQPNGLAALRCIDPTIADAMTIESTYKAYHLAPSRRARCFWRPLPFSPHLPPSPYAPLPTAVVARRASGSGEVLPEAASLLIFPPLTPFPLTCIFHSKERMFPAYGSSPHPASLWQLSPSGEVLLEAMAPADGRLSIRWGLALEADLLMGTDGVRAAVRQHVLKEADLLIGTDGVPVTAQACKRSDCRPTRLSFLSISLYASGGSADRHGRGAIGSLAPLPHVLHEGRREDGRSGGPRWGGDFCPVVCADEQGRGLTQQRSANGEEVRGKIRALFADWPAYKDVIEVGRGELSSSAAPPLTGRPNQFCRPHPFPLPHL